jgi:hypothetical protein
MKMTMPTVSNLLSTLAIVVLVALVVEQRWTQYQSNQQRLEREQEQTYQAGEVVADTPDLRLANTSRTLLVGTTSTCQYCTASMPFYAKLFTLAKQQGVKVVAYTMEDIDRNGAYFASHGITPDTVISASTNHILTYSTPTLVLVQRDGTVIKSWLGQLRPSQEQDVLDLIKEKVS